MMSILRQITFGLTVAAALSLSLGAAVAHSKKETTTPADGAVLQSAPETVGMSFNRPMRITLIRLTDDDGTEHDLERTDDMAPVKEFQAHPDDLDPGAYSVEWRGLSDDGHPMTGSFSFEIKD